MKKERERVRDRKSEAQRILNCECNSVTSVPLFRQE